MESIALSWRPNTISAVEENGTIQIFDGRHRLMALKELGRDEFKKIFGPKKGDNYGVRIEVYQGMSQIELLTLSQS